jgi:hypothetical protein
VPTEIRHLMFGTDEVAQAILDYKKCYGAGLPSGTVISCSPLDPVADGQLSVAMVFAPDGAVSKDARPSRNMLISADAGIVAAALILYCRSRQIPLPAMASKSLERFGQKLGLVLKYTPDPH